MDNHDFINIVAPPSIEDMQKYHLFASVKVAQAILESSWGNSRLSQEAKNLFGLKGSGPAGSIELPTREYSRERGWYTVQAKFRKYNAYEESVHDHTRFLLQSRRYQSVFDTRSFEETCRELEQAGYATDPFYAEKLIRLIQGHRLHRFDVDYSNVSIFAREAWKWAVENQITDGSNPQEVATREQVITIFYRFNQFLLAEKKS
jgi:flagellum-specific peptidoglycan hydrolase FlgJ